MRGGFQPISVGLPEKPYPGSEGITRWKASASVPPCAVGSVSGSMIFSCSITDPGHPCVTIIGSAFSCFDFTWMKWISRPSISVMKFGYEFSRASTLRQSWFAAYFTSCCIVASCTPCVVSDTCSLSGHLVAAMRRRRSASCSSGTWIRKGRMASPAGAAFDLRRENAGDTCGSNADRGRGEKLATVLVDCFGRHHLIHGALPRFSWASDILRCFVGATCPSASTLTSREVPVIGCDALLDFASTAIC